MQRLLRFCSLALVATLGLAGCTSGQTGGQVEVDAACSEKSRSIALDQPSPLGFTAAEVIAFAQGTHGAPLVWTTESETQAPTDVSITVTPDAGLTTIELDLEYVGGAIQYVERTFREGAGHNSDIAPEGDLCPDLLAVEVQVTLETANGAFDDVFISRLTATAPDQAELQVAFEPTGLRGSFSVEIDDAGAIAKQFQVVASFFEDSFSGSIHGLLDAPSDRELPENAPPGAEPRSKTLIRYGYWPDSPEP